MRFITEFEITPDELKYANNPIKGHRKSCAEERLGEIIAESFGWEEKGRISRHGASGERYTLEIEAFPMDKWIEFKSKLLTEITDSNADGRFILKIIKELEFFGKPAGDTITNTK